MNILVTGGAGYIGSVVCEFLLLEGHNLVVIDDLRDGKAGAVAPVAVFFESDFGNQATLDQIFSEHDIDVVIHLAALANVPDSVVNPLDYYENNTAKTIALLQAMVAHKVKKIIFSSTAAVYGEPVYNPIDEKHVKQPVNPYGDSKLMCEQLIKDCSKAYGVKYSIFRYFCAAGATEKNGEARLKESHIIPVIIDQILGRREVVSVFGTNFNTRDGSGVRDFVHVADIANAHVLAVKNIELFPNQEFNLGNGEGFSVLELLTITEKVLGKKVNFKITERRPGDPATLVAAYDKAEEILGWHPQYSIEDIIRSAYNWRINPLY